MYNEIMNTIIKKMLEKEKIEYFGIVPFQDCRIINRPLLERSFDGKNPKSVIMLLVPYYSGEHEGRNLSLYAVPRDYHLYFKMLYSRLEEKLKESFPQYTFKGFSDHSPIGEIWAAAMAGLGVIGDKYQLINEKYGSYTFVGEIITDIEFPEYDRHEVKYCSHCGACSKACPVEDGCLSEMTQRKGEIDEVTSELIKKTGIVWGCDICRSSCPMNNNISVTQISFFLENLTPKISSDEISEMNKEDFLKRAYSWRGRKTILRNLAVYENKDG